MSELDGELSSSIWSQLGSIWGYLLFYFDAIRVVLHLPTKTTDVWGLAFIKGGKPFSFLVGEVDPTRL